MCKSQPIVSLISIPYPLLSKILLQDPAVLAPVVGGRVDGIRPRVYAPIVSGVIRQRECGHLLDQTPLPVRVHDPPLSPHPLTEERTFQLRFGISRPEPKKKPRKVSKPRARKPRVPTRTAEELIEARREYDKARSQTPERKEAGRLRARQVRLERKEAGQCRDCSNPTFPIWLKSFLSNSSMVFQPLSNYGPFLRVPSYNNSMICHFAVRCRRHHGGT